MNIAIIADEGKTELLVQFCLNYCNELSKHNLITEESIAQLINKNTGLKIETIISSGTESKQQIFSRIAYNEIDMLIFFKNPLNKQNDAHNDEIFKACTEHNIQLAINQATAEALILNLVHNNKASE